MIKGRVRVRNQDDLEISGAEIKFVLHSRISTALSKFIH
jgi:hypothetical protein